MATIEISDLTESQVLDCKAMLETVGGFYRFSSAGLIPYEQFTNIVSSVPQGIPQSIHNVLNLYVELTQIGTQTINNTTQNSFLDIDVNNNTTSLISVNATPSFIAQQAAL